jgi:lipopolysaccharide/colanic/teichoic acid biosynthesis glycosyltransferase
VKYSKSIKLVFDRLAAVFLIILLTPIFSLILIMLFITQGKSVFFTQVRTGKGRKSFVLFKFRTLQHSSSKELSMKKRRLTPLGGFFRKLGIDELPQLLNIVKGDMSFVGPRPMPVEYNDYYNKDQIMRFSVKPGIMGWAQVHGRNDISWKRRFQMDVWYVNNISWTLDVKILFMTFILFLKSLGRRNQEMVNMPVFHASKLS